MAESRYEKYICRLPAVMNEGADGSVGELVPSKITPETVRTGVVEAGKIIDTGPMVWCSKTHFAEATEVVESGLITGDCLVRVPPHKHATYNELFMFLGTNPDDLSDLGGEAEFWLGEDEELEKVVINTPSCIFVPPGLARFPLTWKNVKRPCVFVVVSCSPFDPASQREEAVSTDGRPQ